MATFLLLPGAGGAGWYWHRVVPLLVAAGHEAIAVDLPAADERAGLDAYAEIAIRAVASRDDVVLVAQSMGGFTAPERDGQRVVGQRGIDGGPRCGVARSALLFLVTPFRVDRVGSRRRSESERAA